MGKTYKQKICKFKTVLKKTCCNKTYKIYLKKSIESSWGMCNMCGPREGCNRHQGKPHLKQKSWKAHRNKQYKMKKLKDFG